MKYLLLIAVLFGCAQSPVSNRETYVNARSFFSGGREPELPPESRANKELNLVTNTDLLTYGYWDNKIWSITDQGQFRAIGYNYKLGVRLFTELYVEYEHFSKHWLDHEPMMGGFPVQDSIGLNLFLYKRDKVLPGILGDL